MTDFAVESALVLADSVEDSVAEGLDDTLRERGFVFELGAAMRPHLDATGDLSDWPAFAASWNDMPVDTHMADAGRYRRRRYAVYDAPVTGAIVRKAHAPHYQSLDNNKLNGGIDRWFEPIAERAGASETLGTILQFCRELFASQKPDVLRWHVEVHQFRIEAHPDRPGNPTPEGIHRDGVDYALVLMVARRNIASGTTTVHEAGGREIGSFTLTEAFDTAIVDDNRVFHGVTPVLPHNPDEPAYRDVLVVTFRHSETSQGRS